MALAMVSRKYVETDASALILCLGMTSSTCGIYQAESCRGQRRGKLSVIVVLHNVVFYCAATWLTLACSFASGGWQWRLPLSLQVISILKLKVKRLTIKRLCLAW